MGLERVNIIADTEQKVAARALLVSPLMTDTTHPDELRMVRRHSRPLTDMFARILGYQLIVEPTFARLLKAPPSPDAPTRGARRSNDVPFTPRTYTYLCLVCAALLSTEVGEQVLVSKLFDQVRAEAQAAKIAANDRLEDRRNLVHALRWLAEHDIVEETDGSVQQWVDQDGEALLSVRRAVLPYLLARPLHSLPDPDQLLDDGDQTPGPDQPRRRLRRRLVENPVALRAAMTPAERDVLSRERTALAQMMSERFGLELEVRTEGALAYDTARELSDLDFPGPGTVKQASLLVCDVILDTTRPGADDQVQWEGRTLPGVALTIGEVADMLTELTERYGTNWAESLVSNPAVLLEQVIAMLEATGLASVDRVGDRVLVWPPVARYRAQPTQATRKPARLAPAVSALASTRLFDGDDHD